MSKPKKILIQIRFVDLMNKPFANLYHEVRVSGDKYAASAGRSDAKGLGVWIEKPVGTQLDILVRHPLTKKLMSAKHHVIVPAKKGVFRVQAPFSIQTVKLRALDKSGGSYKRSTYKVVAGKGEYEVKTGQDLYTIAKIHNTTWQILAQLNKATIKDPNKIFPDQIIKVPPKGSSLTGTTNEKPDSLKDQTHYKVKKGETLSGISQRSGVSVDELKRINGINDPTKLQAGQTIKLRGYGSAKPQVSSKPTARPTPKPSSKPSSSNREEDGFFEGAMEAAADIAKETVGVIGGAIGSIGDGLEALGDKAKEGLEGVTNAMGGGKNDKPVGKAPATNSSSNPSATSGGYTVKSGDTLSGIAKRHSVNTNELARANGLKLTDTIHPGQKLKIPKGGATSSSTSNSSQSSKPDKPVNVTTRPSNSSDGTPKDVATTNGACICKAHDLIWGKKFNCDERLKLIKICQEFWPNNYLETANSLMAIFAWESGEKFETGTPNKKNSGGTGLIQVMPDTYKGLTGKQPIFENVHNYWGYGKTLTRVKQLADMTVIQYLDIVKDYFKPIKNKDLEFIDFYLHVLFPASSGLPEHAVFAKSYKDLDLPNESVERKKARVEKFSRNNMDKNGDDIVMKAEIAQSIKHFLTDGEKYKSFGNCEKFNVIEKPVSSTLCVNNIKNCVCQNFQADSNGFSTNSEIKIELIKKMNIPNTMNCKAIVLHRTVGASAMSSITAGRNTTTGAHFYVDNNKGKDGQIYQAVSITSKSNHMGRAPFPKTIKAGIGNSTAIGIEVSGLYDESKKEWEELTEKQAKSVACLLVGLMRHLNLNYNQVHFHEDLCSKTDYEGRFVWISIKKYLPNPPLAPKPAPYRKPELIFHSRFPKEQ